MDSDAIYEEVEMNQESDANKDQHTDSEGEMQEVIVGEDVIEQNLDEVVLYESFDNRTVRRRPQVVIRNTSGMGMKSPASGSSAGGSSSSHQRVVQRPVISAQRHIVKTPSHSQIYPRAQSIKMPGYNTVNPSPNPLHMAMKRKADGSPLVVKLEGVRKQRPSDPLTPRPVVAQSKVRFMKQTGCQTDLGGDMLDQYQQVIEEDQQKIALLEDQVRKLKYSPEMFENDDKRTHYFTGLETFVNMVTLFNSCEPELPASSSLTKFEVFMLTLLKLRLRLPMQLLGYMFGVSPRVANYFYNECITILHNVMREIFVETSEEVEVN